MVDQQAQQRFARRMADLYARAALTMLTDLGARSGLFDAAVSGPATSAGLAERAGLQERYVRE